MKRTAGLGALAILTVAGLAPATAAPAGPASRAGLYVDMARK